MLLCHCNCHCNHAARAHGPWTWRWGYAYYYFPTVVARYPHVDGYLWINDDAILNYWQLLKADLNKLWLPDTPNCFKPSKEGCTGRAAKARADPKCLCQGVIPFSGELQERIGIRMIRLCQTVVLRCHC